MVVPSRSPCLGAAAVTGRCNRVASTVPLLYH